MDYYSFLKPALFCLPAEFSHNLATNALKKGYIPTPKIFQSGNLESNVFGIHFPNPVGMAAGFDKNGEIIRELFSFGFGFVEAGTVTPKPQKGNPKPRLFRLVKDQAVINRFGFNNKGCDHFLEQLHIAAGSGVIGANIAKNKDTENALDDYIYLLRHVYGLSDYITINISSPNTPNLRDLQSRKELDQLLLHLMKVRHDLANEHGRKIPVLLKIAPDTNKTQRFDIAMNALEHQIDGLIVSNTTLSRDGLKSRYKSEQGGLSGKPLCDMATDAISEMYSLTSGKLPIIGVGGIFSAEDAYKKIRAGASLVQVYTGLVYKGMGLVNSINKGLSDLLIRDGFKTVSNAVGVDTKIL